MLSFFLVFISSTFRSDHAVELSVMAPWYEVPLYEQVLFFMIDYSTDLATAFVQTTLSGKFVDNEEQIWNSVKSVLPPSIFALLRAKVETGFYLPRAEFYREVARTIDGSNYRDLFVVGEDIKLEGCPLLREDREVFEGDFFPNGLSETYVYANLHNETVAEFVRQLIESGVHFGLRPLAKSDKYGINLRGFGIEMRPFKYSMEYGVKDSSVNKENAVEITDAKDETVERVKENPIEYLNVTAIPHFAGHFAGFLNDRLKRGEDYLTIVRDMAQNYPLFMGEISEAAPNISAARIVGAQFSEESSFSMINGRVMPSTKSDTFTLLDAIQKEMNFRNVLETNFGMTGIQIDTASQTRVLYNTGYVFEWESKYVHYLNDIENDKEYSQWESDLNVFLSQRKPRFIRRNLLNAVIYGDFSRTSSLSQLVGMSRQFSSDITQGLPLRLGIVPYMTAGNKLSRKVAYAFQHIARQSSQLAIRFLLSVIDYAGISAQTFMMNPVKESHFASAYAETVLGQQDFLPWSELHNLYDENSPESKAIEETQRYLYDSAITGQKFLINGREVSLQNGIDIVLYECDRLLQLLQQVFRQERLTSFEGTTTQMLMSYPFDSVPSLDNEVLYEKAVGLGLYSQTLWQQMDFLNWFENIEWTVTDHGPVAAFYILFSNNQKEIDEFLSFAKAKHHHPTCFAVNPEISKRLLKRLGWKRNETHLIANGRVFTSLSQKRLELIDRWLSQRVVPGVLRAMDRAKYKRTTAILYFSCIVCDWRSELITRDYIRGRIWDEHSSLIYPGKDESLIHWDIVMNPFKRDFQRIIGIAHYIQRMGIADVRLILTPPVTMTEPISTYYRNALTRDSVLFTMLNDTTTYSSMADMPDSWIFESMRAPFDLDNILLMELSPSLHEAQYVLTNIKVEGVCVTEEGSYAEGAELALFDTRGTRLADTLVMMLNGYWQLPANPGRWNVELGGVRSKVIYEMLTPRLTVTSFANQDKVLQVKVKPGKEDLKVYNVTLSEPKNATTVNVFSVASGHLYERLLKIMMLSVRRQSKHDVKFWIIKSFLSPQFKATLPIMSKMYNFSYQLVSYKWPTWLRAQYEKQRIIWGNKILFLDVIFPLDLDRVVYIDSDQVVRTDLIELMRMDFHGAPYAFTPFCNSRVETEPFRFWKHGYWLDHLQGKPYHISALFAIDLQTFRSMAAGDWLRVYYQRLSSDPASLANLDQDLPNYAQFHIPIYSLPQNWLWCETWCSDDTMATAKTIDLCNNPLTKKPKLFIAQTRIEEWPALDEEARNISAGANEYEKKFLNPPNLNI